ncbi:sensor histidine kinase [Streptomyces sp. NPDC054849]
MELTDQDVTQAVRDRVTAWTPVFHAAGLELTAAGLPEDLRAHALPDAAGRILDALLDNAVKFVPPGGRVEVRAARGADGCAVVRVTDDGPGVPEEQRGLLLRRFARAPGHQNVPGSGLGLAIADEIARISGGGLDVAGNVPHGLVVGVRLPSP